jgi:bifunctional N-acetylglucosamine-1-phosphate-uridyltransferase/glucosamine-1-phosphate-acetyltransferase GlmU-like protein
MKVELNIGLNNNPFDLGQALSLTIATLSAHKATGFASRLAMGKFNDSDEPTLVMALDWPATSTASLQSLIEALSTIMTQQCIAVYLPETNQGFLEYEHLWDGEKYTFDIEYFIRF